MQVKIYHTLHDIFPPFTLGPSGISMLHTLMLASHNGVSIHKLLVVLDIHSYLQLS